MAPVYKLTVKDSWLAACGLDHTYKTLFGVMSQGVKSSSPMGAHFVAQRFPSDKHWEIFACRLDNFELAASETL